MAIPEGITFSLALLGAGLGVLNTWRTFNRDKVKIKVEPKTFFSGRKFDGLCVEITNLSYLTVCIKQITFTVKGEPNTRVFLGNDFLDNFKLPYRLEPRMCVTCRFNPEMFEYEEEIAIGLDKIEVTTACGKIVLGDSGELKAFSAQFSYR